MKFENTLVKRLIFEKKDFVKLNLGMSKRLNEEYVILSKGVNRYICHKIEDDYKVIGIYKSQDFFIRKDKRGSILLPSLNPDNILNRMRENGL